MKHTYTERIPHKKDWVDYAQFILLTLCLAAFIILIIMTGPGRKMQHTFINNKTSTNETPLTSNHFSFLL